MKKDKFNPYFKIVPQPVRSVANDLLFFVDTSPFPYPVHWASSELKESFPNLIRLSAFINEALGFLIDMQKEETLSLSAEELDRIYELFVLTRNLYLYNLYLLEAEEEFGKFEDFMLMRIQELFETTVHSALHALARLLERAHLVPLFLVRQVYMEEEEFEQYLERRLANDDTKKLVRRLRACLSEDIHELSIDALNRVYLRFQQEAGLEKRAVVLPQGKEQRRKMRLILLIFNRDDKRLQKIYPL